MEDPCKECWPKVDPYECWGCQNIEKHLEYIREKLKSTSEPKNIKEES